MGRNRIGMDEYDKRRDWSLLFLIDAMYSTYIYLLFVVQGS